MAGTVPLFPLPVVQLEGRVGVNRERERGSTVPLLAVAVVLVGMMVMGLGRMGAAGAARATARTAADAAALAGAADGRAAAEALASANGAELVSYEGIGLDTRVTVRVGPAQAVGRARRAAGLDGAPGRGGAGGGGAAGAVAGLAPAMKAALARAEQLLGEPVPVVSGYRSPATQASLWANRGSNPYPVAPPGSSMHEKGLAVDVPLAFVPRLAAVAAQAGLCHPHADDPIHFEVCR